MGHIGSIDSTAAIHIFSEVELVTDRNVCRLTSETSAAYTRRVASTPPMSTSMDAETALLTLPAESVTLPKLTVMICGSITPAKFTM